MKINKELKTLQKAEAIMRMKMLDLHPKIIDDFLNENKIYKSDICGILFGLNADERAIVKQFEETRRATVYHVIKSYTPVGILLSLLFVSCFEDEWDADKKDINRSITVSHVRNLTCESFSESGLIGFEKYMGGLIRIR